jgi:hypothetical protein
MPQRQLRYFTTVNVKHEAAKKPQWSPGQPPGDHYKHKRVQVGVLDNGDWFVHWAEPDDTAIPLDQVKAALEKRAKKLTEAADELQDCVGIVEVLGEM